MYMVLTDLFNKVNFVYGYLFFYSQFFFGPRAWYSQILQYFKAWSYNPR